MDKDNQDKPRRERLLDHVPEHAEEIERQIQASTTRQRIEDSKRRNLGGEYEPEERIW